MTTINDGYAGDPLRRPTEVVDFRRPDGARARVAWSAIFAGVVMVVGTELLLNSLGAGVGLGFVTPMTGGTPTPGSMGAGAGIWVLVSTIIAFVFSGFVAGRLAGAPTRFDGALHGLVVWGLTLLLALYLLGAAAGGIIGGVFHIAGGAASAATGAGAQSAASQVASAAGIDQNTVQNELQSYMAPVPTDPSQLTPEQAQKAVAMEAPNLLAGGQRAAEARQRIIPIIAAQQHITQEEAAQRFDATQARILRDRQQAVQDATQAAQVSAAAASKASYVTFFALLIGAIAAAVGGLLAAPRATVTATRRVA